MASVAPPEGSIDPKSIAASLLDFNVMIGGKLIKIIYFIGLVLIGLGVLAGALSALAMMSYSFGTGLGMLIALAIGGAFGVLVWRFSCELWVLLFRMHDLLVDIRNKP